MRHFRLQIGLFGLATLHALTCAAQSAPPPLEAFKTESGCEVRMDPAIKFPGFTLTATTWSGDCVDGLAHGFGAFEFRQAAPTAGESVTSFRTHMRRGRPLGYTLLDGVMIVNGQAFRGGGWAFYTEDFSVGGSGRNMGLWVDLDTLRAEPVPMPIESPAAPRGVEGLAGRDKQVMLTHAFQSAPAAPKAYRLMEMPVGGSGQSNYANRKETPCPPPGGLATCGALIEQVVAPYRRDVLSAIEQSRAAVDARLQGVRRSPAARPSGSGQAAPGSARANKTTGDAGIDLAGMSSVELFSRSQDSLAQGNRDEARRASNELSRRFPGQALAQFASHALAEPVAAAQAPVMAPTATPARPAAARPAPAERATDSTGAGSGSCAAEVTAINAHHNTAHGPDHRDTGIQYPSFQLRQQIAELEAMIAREKSGPPSWTRDSTVLHRSLELCRARVQLSRNEIRDRARARGPLPSSTSCVAEADRIGQAARRAQPQGIVATARVAHTVAVKAIDAVKNCPPDPYLDQLVSELEQSAAVAHETCAMVSTDKGVCSQPWPGL